MKKIISILLLTALVAAMGQSVEAKKKDVKTSSVVELVRKYRSHDDFTVVSIGSFGMGMMKTLAKMSLDKEERAALDIIKGIKRLIVVEFEDARAEVRDEFNSKLSELLKDSEMILEAKDEGDVVHIYGTPARSGEAISDIIIHVPGDYALICLFGSIRADDVANLLEMTNE